MNFRGTLSNDTKADTVCAGKAFIPFEFTGQQKTVNGFNNLLGSCLEKIQNSTLFLASFVELSSKNKRKSEKKRRLSKFFSDQVSKALTLISNFTQNFKNLGTRL